MYNAVLPGAAERIIAMAEAEAAHVRMIETEALSGELRERRLGQICGLGIGVAALGTAALALFLGHETAATVIGGTTVVGLVSVFVIGRVYQSS